MSDDNNTDPRPQWASALAYMGGGAVGTLVLYAFLFRRGLIEGSFMNSPLRAPIVALVGVVLGWIAHRIVSQPR